MEKFILKLPLSGCKKELLKLQGKLSDYRNHEVETLNNGFNNKKREKEILKELHIGTVWTAYTGRHDLAISFKSTSGHVWIKEFSNLEVSLTPNSICCVGCSSNGGHVKYEFKFS